MIRIMDMQQLTISNIWVEECLSPGGRTNTFYIPRPQTAFAILKSGSGEFRDDVRSGEMRCKDIFIVPFGATYTSSWHGDPYADYISIHFNMPLFQNPLRKYFVQSIKAKRDLSDEFESILNAYQVNDCAAVLKAFYAIFAELLPDLACEELLSVDPRIAEAMRYLADNCTKHLSIPEIARMCGMSEGYFYTKFREYANLTPIEYKNKAAISFSEELLTQNPQMTIEEISEASGFESSIYFRRLFKAITGMSPTEYRKNERGDL